MEHFRFLLEAARNRQVASVAPTSGPSVRHICRPIPTDRPAVVLELGPGTGAFTRWLLRILPPESHLIAIELNKEFVKDLRKRAGKFTTRGCRFHCIHGDAAEMQSWLSHFDHQHADYIVSGIPFSLLEPDQRRSIVEGAVQSLHPQGEMIVYQCTFLMKDLLEEHFHQVLLDRCFLNLPPLCVMRCLRETDAQHADAGTQSGRSRSRVKRKARWLQ